MKVSVSGTFWRALPSLVLPLHTTLFFLQKIFDSSSNVDLLLLDDDDDDDDDESNQPLSFLSPLSPPPTTTSSVKSSSNSSGVGAGVVAPTDARTRRRRGPGAGATSRINTNLRRRNVMAKPGGTRDDSRKSSDQVRKSERILLTTNYNTYVLHHRVLVRLKKR